MVLPYKPRTKSQELLVLEYLYVRMKLSGKLEQHYLNLEKGYEGEILFDSFTEQLQSDVLILNDLLLKTNHTTYQIDSLIISPDKLYVYEVKNFDGDHFYDPGKDKFYRKTSYEITNPLHQLSRSESLFTQLLHQQGFSFPIQSFVVFINDAFTLYQSPFNKPIIHPTQVRSHLQQLNVIPTNLKRNHKHLADKLVGLHISNSPFTQIPPYEYGQLKKGIICANCQSLSTFVEGHQCICRRCAHKESVEGAVMRSVREFQLLFPERKVTTSGVHDWCRIVESKQRVKRILDKNMKKEGTNRWIYYK